MKKLIAVLICLLAVLCVLTACQTDPEPTGDTTRPVDLPGLTTERPTSRETESTPPETVPATEATTVPTETPAPETHGFFRSDVDKFEIVTPYAILQYPKKWEDRVVVEQTQGDWYTVAFYAISEGGNIRVFDVVFGESPDVTFPLGTFESLQGEVEVSIVDYSGEAVEQAPEELVSDIYEMSEDMNEVISGLVYNYGLEVR